MRLLGMKLFGLQPECGAAGAQKKVERFHIRQMSSPAWKNGCLQNK